MKKKIYFTLVLVLLISSIATAQKTPPTPGAAAGGPPIGPGLPIDGGILLLCISGAIYGVKKLKE